MTRREIKDVICEELSLERGSLDGKEDKKFSEIGIDSLDITESYLSIEEKFKIDLNLRISDIKTLNVLFTLLEKHGLED